MGHNKGMSFAFGSAAAPPSYLQGRQVAHLPKRLPMAKRGTRRRVTVRGEEILAKPCNDVTEFGTPELKTLIDDMYATMEVASGVGLAANQIDVPLRIFVFDCPDADDVRHVGHICNPVIDPDYCDPEETDFDTEGCLSAPGPHAEVERPWRARVTGQDMNGNDIAFEGVGLLARCFHHETDHLNGIMYVDHLDKALQEKVMAESVKMRGSVYETWDENASKLGKGDPVPFEVK